MNTWGDDGNKKFEEVAILRQPDSPAVFWLHFSMENDDKMIAYRIYEDQNVDSLDTPSKAFDFLQSRLANLSIINYNDRISNSNCSFLYISIECSSSFRMAPPWKPRICLLTQKQDQFIW